MEKEEELNAQGKIEKNDKGKDMLEAKTFTDPIKILDFGNFPKTEYKPEDAAYDRNQFIRSYFRYKDYKVENGLLTVKGKQINFENESLDVCKITLPIRPIIIFSKLYSFDEIVQKVFSSGIIRDKETKEILKIDFPLTSSVIEKVAKKYGIEYIMFSKSTIRYLFLKDLLYLDDNVPCLKFRNLTITHKVCCTLTDKSRNNIYPKQKLSFHPRLMCTKSTRLGLFSIPHTSAPSLLLTQQTSRSKRYQEPRIPASHAESAGSRALSGLRPITRTVAAKRAYSSFES